MQNSQYYCRICYRFFRNSIYFIYYQIWLTWLYKFKVLKGESGSDLRLADIHHVRNSLIPTVPNYRPLNIQLNAVPVLDAVQERLTTASSRLEGRSSRELSPEDLFSVKVDENSRRNKKKPNKKLKSCCGDFCDLECVDPVNLTPATKYFIYNLVIH